MARTSVIDVEQLTKKVNDILKEYADEINEGMAISAKSVGKEVVKQLKSTSPKRKGDYAKSWRMLFQQNRLGSCSVIVYNEKHYQLTHLLENGHVKANGKGRTRAFPHIKPAEEAAVEAFTKQIEELIQ